MNDLNTLLERAAGRRPGRPVDAHADLTRGHRALSRTRRRRGAARSAWASPPPAWWASAWPGSPTRAAMSRPTGPRPITL